LCKCCAHIAIMAYFINDVELFMRIYIERTRSTPQTWSRCP
jgi:hypothetical protein